MAKRSTAPRQNGLALSKEEQGLQTREKLLQAAVETIREHGYGGTSTTMIVKRLGVTRGALNHHFSDKDEFIGAVGRHLLERRIAGVGAGIDPALPLREKLRRYADSLLSLYLSGDMLVWIDILLTARRDRASMRKMRHFFNEMDVSLYDGWSRLFAADAIDQPTLIAARDVLSNFAAGMAINRIFAPDERYWRDMLVFIEGMLAQRMAKAGADDWPTDTDWANQFTPKHAIE